MKMVFLSLTFLISASSYAGDKYDLRQLNDQINTAISHAGSKRVVVENPVFQKIVCKGVAACKTDLVATIADINKSLQNIDANNRAEIVENAMSKLVNFTARTEPTDFSNQLEINQIEALDSVADKYRNQLVIDFL